MADVPVNKGALARRVWALMFDFFISTRAQRDQALARHNLTPNDARTLAGLTAKGGRSMRTLADEWGCDASNATWMVDRLERLGLAQRVASKHDRRVRLVVLTKKGAKTKNALAEELHAPPPALLDLDTSALQALVSALEKVSPLVNASSTGPRGSQSHGVRRTPP